MAHRRERLLAQIEEGVLDDTVPLSSLLHKCVVLGGRAGSKKLYDWARRELNGYTGADTVPDYRHIPAPFMVVITNNAGYNPINQRIYASDLPDKIVEIMGESGVRLDTAILGGGIGELEALANRDANEHRLSPSWADFIMEWLNEHQTAPNSRVAQVYWSVSNASIQGLLVGVRTALADLVAEMVELTPQEQDVPDKAAADQAIQFVITGDQATINLSNQHATNGGTNVNVSTPGSGSVTVSGAHGTAIGSQTASGANSSVVGTQTAQGPHSTVTGQDATNAREQPAKQSWWARLRKRGVIVAVSTVIGASATVVATVITLIR